MSPRTIIATTLQALQYLVPLKKASFLRNRHRPRARATRKQLGILELRMLPLVLIAMMLRNLRYLGPSEKTSFLTHQ